MFSYSASTRHRGFTFVEVMIAVALLSGLSLAFMSITKNSAKSSTKLQFDSDITLITNEINGILSDPAVCLATFASITSPDNIDGKFFTKLSGHSPAQGYGNGNLFIQSYSLITIGPQVYLSISFENKSILKNTSGPATTPRKIGLYVTGAPGAITYCRSMSANNPEIWSHGTGPNIHYSGGNVGIGTGATAPAALLDVAGGFRPGDQTQVTVCDASTEGTQRYNKISHAMEYCGWDTTLGYYFKEFGGPAPMQTAVNSGGADTSISFTLTTPGTVILVATASQSGGSVGAAISGCPSQGTINPVSAGSWGLQAMAICFVNLNAGTHSYSTSNYRYHGSSHASSLRYVILK